MNDQTLYEAVEEFVARQKYLLQLENEEEYNKVQDGTLHVFFKAAKSEERAIIKVEFEKSRRNNADKMGGFMIGETLMCVNNHYCENQQLSGRGIKEAQGVLVEQSDRFLTICFKTTDWEVFRDTPLRDGFFLSGRYDDFTHLKMLSALDKLKKCLRLPITQIAFGNDLQEATELLTEEDPRVRTDYIDYYNESLSEDQKQVVAIALKRKHMAIIQGPPGTGKTTALIEILHQLAEMGKRVLLCAPTNVAIDNLAIRFAESGGKPLRVGSELRMAEEVQKYSLNRLMVQDPEYKIIKGLLREMRRGDHYASMDTYQERNFLLMLKITEENPIIFSTLSMSMFEETENYSHFDVVIIDEASQAMESLTWIAIPNAPKLILAGDIYQLQPMVSSQEAKDGGLDVSLMQRMIQKLGELAYVDLRTQFRMNSKIMAWSNKLFYDNRLIAHESVADKVLSDMEVVLTRPLTKECVMFIDTKNCGAQCREVSDASSSKGNIGEAIIVSNLIQYFIKACNVKESDIGVITPYQLQSIFIQNLLSGSPGVQVSTVDGYQGREKEVIIFSFVRSNQHKQLGFVKNERRLNVAVTRAKKFFAVVADSRTVSTCKIIKELITNIPLDGIFEDGETYLADTEENREKCLKLLKIVNLPQLLPVWNDRRNDYRTQKVVQGQQKNDKAANQKKNVEQSVQAKEPSKGTIRRMKWLENKRKQQNNEKSEGSNNENNNGNKAGPKRPNKYQKWQKKKKPNNNGPKVE